MTTEARTTPAARLDELTLLYERHAYVVWNLALRTTLEDGAAETAARRAFAAQVANPDVARLALDAARLAVDAAGGVDPRGIEQPVLAATAHLAAVQRAVLALAELTDLPQAAVAARLGIDPEREERLRDGAYEQLGLLLGVTSAEARAAYADLSWAEPPQELWQAVYPELHTALTEQAQAAAGAVPTASGRGTAAARPRRRSGRRVRAGALVACGALAVAGVAWAATGGGSGSEPSDTGGQGPTALAGGSGGSSYSSDTAGEADAADDGERQRGEGGDDAEEEEEATSLLTPEELDRLRREEIEKLKQLERRKSDRRLPQRERDRAARGVNDLLKLARARQRAAEERELALRRQLAREREARVRERNRRQEQPDERPAPTTQREQTDEQPDDGGRPRGGKQGGGGDRAEAECLYDPSNGAYICPE